MHVETKAGIKIDSRVSRRESAESPGGKGSRKSAKVYREQERDFREDAATPFPKGGRGGERAEEEPVHQGRTVAPIEHNEPVRAVARRHERVGV